jgi:hypothetical protein
VREVGPEVSKLISLVLKGLFYEYVFET